MYFRQIEDPYLAQYAYLIGCQRTGEAIVIDPERDVDRYRELARAAGLTLTAAAETHIHADFLSGCRELAERHGLRIFLSDEGGEEWRYRWPDSAGYDVQLLRDGDTFLVGMIEIRAIHTPGHTPEHLSYLVTDTGGGAEEPIGLASGDFVFVGDLGRPDLLESAAGEEGAMRPAAQKLYQSVQEFAGFPDFLQVWPGHGAGSACGKALGAVPVSTVGYELRHNSSIAAAREGRQFFVSSILQGQPEPPLYFARMKTENREGPALLEALPRPRRTTPEKISELSALSAAVVVDTRENRNEFMSGHFPGSIYAPLNSSFATVTGSLLDPSSPLILIIDEDKLDDAVRVLVRIGLDLVEGYATPSALETWLKESGAASIPTLQFPEALELSNGPDWMILDVRGISEYQDGHIEGAFNIAHTRLKARLGEIKRQKKLIVHCLSGARAAVASSFLAREGFDVRYVDDNIGRLKGQLRKTELTAG